MLSPKIGTFFAKCLILTLPFILLLASYIYFDPGQVLRHYDSFNQVELLNRDFISTQTFINNNPTQQYQSFILGNSRSGVFYTRDWAPYINDKNPFHFDASGESLYGMYHKVKFLDANAKAIKNVLLVCDRGLLKNVSNPSGGPLFMTDSRTSDNSWLEFQIGYIKAYFTDFYFFNFLKRKLFKQAKPGDTKNYGYLPISNDTPNVELDAQVTKDSVAYYKEYESYFNNLPKPVKGEEEAVIKEKQLAMLQEMAQIFKKHNTNYRIVISPLYDKLPLHTDDVEALKKVFDANRVHDYSGVNKFTSTYRNYYEASHYRPHVAREIMREIYSTPAQ